jgi:hypothetical protein
MNENNSVSQNLRFNSAATQVRHKTTTSARVYALLALATYE